MTPVTEEMTDTEIRAEIARLESENVSIRKYITNEVNSGSMDVSYVTMNVQTLASNKRNIEQLAVTLELRNSNDVPDHPCAEA